MLVKSTKAEFKVDSDQRIIEGYASVFGNVDEHGDIVVPGAFAKTISERVPMGKVKVCRDHRTPIGMPIVVEEDTKGLFTRSKISNTPAGDEALTLARDGVLSTMSFAYDTIKSDYQVNGDRTVRVLRELKLYEYGPVLFPANELAAITAVKSDAPLGDWLGAFLTHLESIKENPAALSAAAVTFGPKLPELQKYLDSLRALQKGEPVDLTTPPAKEPLPTSDDPQAVSDLQSLLTSLAVVTAR